MFVMNDDFLKGLTSMGLEMRPTDAAMAMSKGCEVLDDGAEDGTAIISLSGMIYPKSIFASFYTEGVYINAPDVGAALKKVKAPNLTIKINSPGGIVTEGMAIFNMLMEWRDGEGRSLTTVVDGMAASMASVLFLAGEVRQMHEFSSTLMIHEVMGGAFGRAAVLKTSGEFVEGLNSRIAGLYARVTSTAEAEHRRMMTSDPVNSCPPRRRTSWDLRPKSCASRPRRKRPNRPATPFLRNG